MQLPLTPILRLPRVLLEHALPLEGEGLSPTTEFLARDGLPLLLTFGGVDKWSRAGAPARTPTLCPGFTLDSLTVLAALLALTERMSGGLITYNQLFKALGSRSCCSAHHREALKSSLSLLESIDLRVENPASVSPPHFEKLLTLTATHTRPIFGRVALGLVVHFSPSLLDCLADPKASAPVHFGALLSLRSRIARSLYLILSTWAHYSRAHPQRPFRITLSKLLTHLGLAPLRFRSQRRAVFFGHRRQSLFDELQGLPTPYGALRLSMIDASSVDDDCLLVYHEAKQTVAPDRLENTSKPRALLSDQTPDRPACSESPAPAAVMSWPSRARGAFDSGSATPAKLLLLPSQPALEARRAGPQDSAAGLPAAYRRLKLYSAWAASGRPDAEFLRRVRSTSLTLTQDDLSLLLAARIPPSSCETFLTMAKKLLPSRTWLDLLGEAKYAAHAPLPPRSPTGKLINEILSALRGVL